LKITQEPTRIRGTVAMFNALSFTFLGGMISSYVALRFVNYPTMV
jgi:hypothetical protein